MGTGDAVADRLVAAVRRGDSEQVRELLDAGADPDADDGSTGLPVLCRAISADDQPVAEALVQGGADPLRRLPDGTTPLLRAMEGGSPGLTRAVLPEVALYPGPPREELLGHARRLAGIDPEAELRRRTGLPGPAGRTRQLDDIGCWYERLTLGGLALGDGHAAFLTALETKLRLRTSFAELLARALTRPDRDHAVWTASVMALGARLDDETWAEATRRARDRDPLHRLFAADVLLSTIIADAQRRETTLQDRALDLLPWAGRERDTDVLSVLLNALTWTSGPATDALGLAHVTHPDPRIRGWVPDLLDRAGGMLRPESLAAVLALARDPDPEVREHTCFWLSHYRGPEPEIADVLVELTYDVRQRTRAVAVAALALRDDPRCVAAEPRIGPLEPGMDPDTLPLTAVWWYQRRHGEQKEEQKEEPKEEQKDDG
ncbi:HEAT repeat domain-containing protein [Streptomyces sp. NPDC001833]|uniref:HEAT repeat domain-containing protein n=1 Tax=Streptomyces sp. NPDC001833 TaxID=3154658 RepID=UPI0033262B94